MDPARHKLRAYNAWAVDAWLLRDLRERGGVGVRIETIDGETLEAAVEAFDAHGVAFDHGFGEQVRLASKYWQGRERPDNGQLRLVI